MPNGAVPSAGQRVKQLRSERGWTQEELAVKVGCSKKTIENIETGKAARASTLRDIAQAFGVEYGVLFQADEPPARADAPAKKGEVPRQQDEQFGANWGEVIEPVVGEKSAHAPPGEAPRRPSARSVKGFPGGGTTKTPDTTLRQYLTDRLLIGDVAAVWSDTLGGSLREQLPIQSIGECIEELLLRAEKRGLMNLLRGMLSRQRPDLDLDGFLGRCKEIDLESGIALRQRVDLYAIVHSTQISAQDLVGAYSDSLPGQADMLELIELWDMIVDLSDRPVQESGQLPIVFFAERIANLTLDPRERSQLRQWIKQTAASFGPGPQFPTPTLSHKPITPSRSHDVALQVQLIPDLNNPNRSKGKLYSVEVCLWTGDATSPPPFRSAIGSPPLALDDIPTLLDEVLCERGCTRHIPSVKDLTFEFILPLELLSHDVDRWKMKRTQPTEYVYGMNHALVVRSLDRLESYANDAFRGQRLFEEWQEKWRRFQARSSQCSGHQLRWHSNNQPSDLDELICELQDDVDAICFGLTHPPADERVFIPLIWGGIPVAVWARESGMPAQGGQDLCSRITEVVGGRSWAELPDSIKIARRDGKKSYPRNCLALLWDDPTRIPLRYLPKGVYSDEQLAGVQWLR